MHLHPRKMKMWALNAGTVARGEVGIIADCSAFFWFLISCCLVSYTLTLWGIFWCLLLFFLWCLDLIAHIGLLFVVVDGTKHTTCFPSVLSLTLAWTGQQTALPAWCFIQYKQTGLPNSVLIEKEQASLIFLLPVLIRRASSGSRFWKQHTGSCRASVYGLALTREILN